MSNAYEAAFPPQGEATTCPCARYEQTVMHAYGEPVIVSRPAASSQGVDGETWVCPKCGGGPVLVGTDEDGRREFQCIAAIAIKDWDHVEASRRYGYAPVAPPETPEPEAGAVLCETCGHRENGPSECHYTNEDGSDRWCSVDGCPCDTTRPGAAEGAGEWTPWQGNHVTTIWRSKTGATREVPVSLEQAIAVRFALEQYDILKARAERAERERDAARAEAEKMRAAYEYLLSVMQQFHTDAHDALDAVRESESNGEL